jgi:K+-sensing histidine kinase KdpD
MARFLSRDRIAIAAALLAPLAAAAVVLPVRASWSNTNVALVLVVVVVAVAAIGNRVAGGVAAVSAAAWFDFFFTRPYQQFRITGSADVQTAVLLLLVGLAVSQLAAHARRLRVITITDAGYLTQIHEAAELATSPGGPDAVVDYVKEQLTSLLGLEGCRFEYGSLLGHPPRLEPDGTVTRGHQRWDVERWGLPREEIELRTFGNGQFHGRFMLQPKPDSVPSRRARLVAVTLADQAGRAFGTGGTTSGDD